jgi:hypothetical protein
MLMVHKHNYSIDNYLYRYDWLAKKNLRAGYFVWAMTAYGLGMIDTLDLGIAFMTKC